MLGHCNNDPTIVIALWRSVWTELLHATSKAHRHVDYSLPRSQIYTSLQPVEAGAMDRYVLVYHGDSSAGRARVIVPMRWDDPQIQRIFWAHDIVAGVTKQYHLEFCTHCTLMSE